MTKPFDATMRKLLELEPVARLRFLHVTVEHPERVRVIDSNLSTVTAEADKVSGSGRKSHGSNMSNFKRAGIMICRIGFILI